MCKKTIIKENIYGTHIYAILHKVNSDMFIEIILIMKIQYIIVSTLKVFWLG